jgi:hypothetical protein
MKLVNHKLLEKQEGAISRLLFIYMKSRASRIKQSDGIPILSASYLKTSGTIEVTNTFNGQPLNAPFPICETSVIDGRNAKSSTLFYTIT